MSTRATGTFQGKTWDEQPYSEIDAGPKLTRVSVTNSFRGDVEGDGTLEYLIYYDGKSGSFIGMEHVVGRIGDRSGSFVLQHTGTFEGADVKGTWVVVPGSGTGDLRGLRGEGSFIAEHGNPQASMTLDYDFA